MAAINPRNPESWGVPDKSVLNKGDEELGKTRVALFFSWVGNAKRLRSHLRDFYDSLLEELGEEFRYKVDGTGMLSSSQSVLTNKIEREFGPSLRKIDGEFRDSLRRAVNRSARAQMKHLIGRGVEVPTQQEYRFIVDDALRSLEREFPAGSGVTYIDRLNRIHRQHTNQLNNVVVRSYGSGAQQKIVSDTKGALLYSRPGKSPVTGGSVSKKTMQLMVAEKARLTNEVEVSLIRASGINFAYWRLSPMHKWSGGSEVCEAIASGEDPAIDRVVRLLPAGGAGVDTTGLYRLEDWPSYPHPFCKCFPEAALI